MHDWRNQILNRLATLKLSPTREAEIVEELAQHLEDRYQEFLTRGMTEDEARRAALGELSDEDLLARGLKQVEREVKQEPIAPGAETGSNFLSSVWQDIRYGLRQLRRNPGFTAVAVFTLALGIGANTAIFSLIDAVLLKTIPVQNPQQLVLADWTSQAFPAEGIVSSMSGAWYQDKSGGTICTSFTYPLYEQIRANNLIFSSLTAFAGNGSDLNVSYDGQPGRADGQLVSGTFFSTLGVRPILGRVFDADDDRLAASPAAVISYGYWERRFGRDPGIVGRTITVNGVPFSIVGVSPAEFYGVQPGRSVEVWLPLHTQTQVEPRWSPAQPEPGKEAARPSSLFEARDNWWVVIMGRLKPGVSQQQARAALEVILQQSIAFGVKPTTKPQSIPHLALESGSKGLDYLRREFSKPLFILMTVVGLVLLIACANLANLLLARCQSRQKEIAVRLAMGAGRRRLVRQLLTESVLLAGLGGAASLILAFWGTDVLVAFMSSGRWPIILKVVPDPRVLAFTAALSLLTGIMFGLSPALRSTRVDLTPALKENPRDLSSGLPGKRRFRLGLGSGLVVIQVSLSFALLVAAGLFVRTLTNLESANAGFNERNLLLFGIDPTQDGYMGQRLTNFYYELLRRLEALPGVRSVSLSASTLIGGGGNFQRIHIKGYLPKSGQKMGAAINWIGPKFFETLGIPVVLGRAIDKGDTAGKAKVVVVNEQFVRQFLGSGNPIGRRFGLGDKGSDDTEIVGVVGDAKYFDLRHEAPATIYVPWSDLNGAMHFEVRTADNPMSVVGAVRRVAGSMDRNVALYDVQSQDEQINQSLFPERLFARFTGSFAVLAALLACVGIYGIMAFAVTRRTREIGIRMALGASRSEIGAMILRETIVLVGIGIAIGIGVALAASRLIASLLYGLEPDNPLTIAVAALLMVGAATLAAYLPARRATKVDPMVALRYE